MTSVLLVDDQELVRTGLRMILGAEEDLEVVAEAADGASAVAEPRAENTATRAAISSGVASALITLSTGGAPSAPLTAGCSRASWAGGSPASSAAAGASG